MNLHTSYHLSGGETVTANTRGPALLFDIGGGSTFGIFAGQLIPAAERIRFLRELAEAASDLADEINLREIERAS